MISCTDAIFQYLQQQPAAHHDLVKNTDFSAGGVHHALKTLHMAGKIHIAEYRAPKDMRGQDRMVRVYKAGPGFDAPEPPAVEKTAAAQRADTVLLKLQGSDLTIKQLAAMLSCSQKTMVSVIRQMRAKNRVHVCRYNRDESGHAVYVYRAGPGADVLPRRIAVQAPKPDFKVPPRDPLMAALFGSPA